MSACAAARPLSPPIDALFARSGRSRATAVLAGLDNGGATFPPPSQDELDRPAPVERGGSRWKLKADIRRLLRPADGSRGPGVCGCGAPGYEVDAVTLHRRESGAGVSGVYRCDSPWLCPTCSEGKSIERKKRLVDVIDATHALGGSVAFVTLTIRHDLTLALADAKRIVRDASRTARQGAPWLRIKEAGGILGVVPGVEALHSIRTGWHFHLHLLVPGLGSPKEVLEAAHRLVARYIEKVRGLGADALLEGQDVQLVRDGEAAEYAAKGSAAWEVAGGLKAARSAVSRTPWDLARLAAAGDPEGMRLWQEYAETMPGTRSCVVSASLAKALGIEAADDEEEPGEEQLTERDSAIGTLPADIWRRVWMRGVAWRVLDAVESNETWPTIDALARRLGAADPPPPKPREFVSPEQIARTGRAMAEAHGWTVGEGIRRELEERRRSAEARGHELIPPPLGTILRIAAGEIASI